MSRKLRQDRCQSGGGFHVGTRIRNGGLTDTRRLLVRDRIDSIKLVLSLSALSSNVLSDYHGVAY